VKDFVADFADKMDLIEVADAGSFLRVTHEDLFIKLLDEFIDDHPSST
jgi:hypothetical protein